MSPTALLSPSPAPDPSPIPKGPVLVVGSPATAQDGQYQAAILSKGNRHVEKQMVDRLLDGAASLPSAHFALAHVVLAPSDYKHWSAKLPLLLAALHSSLAPNALLYLSNQPSTNSSLLDSHGFQLVGRGDLPDVAVAQKVSQRAGTPMQLLRRRKDDSKAAKKALWAVNAPTSPSIDAESLLTESDRAKPMQGCELPEQGVSRRRKKACKNCTCGLAEVEAEERQRGNIVMLNGAEQGTTQEVGVRDRDRLKLIAQTTPKATSSCGSCYLGDAFRCASCPYLGLPAFKPGEQVRIDIGMDDVV